MSSDVNYLFFIILRGRAVSRAGDRFARGFTPYIRARTGRDGSFENLVGAIAGVRQTIPCSELRESLLAIFDDDSRSVAPSQGSLAIRQVRHCGRNTVYRFKLMPWVVRLKKAV